MEIIEGMVWLDEIDEYVTVQEYKDYIKYLQNKYDN